MRNDPKEIRLAARRTSKCPNRGRSASWLRYANQVRAQAKALNKAHAQRVAQDLTEGMDSADRFE